MDSPKCKSNTALAFTIQLKLNCTKKQKPVHQLQFLKLTQSLNKYWLVNQPEFNLFLSTWLEVSIISSSSKILTPFTSYLPLLQISLCFYVCPKKVAEYFQDGQLLSKKNLLLHLIQKSLKCGSKMFWFFLCVSEFLGSSYAMTSPNQEKISLPEKIKIIPFKTLFLKTHKSNIIP